MFNLTSAVVLGLMVVGLIELAKTLVNGPNSARIVVGVCFVISFVAVELIAASDFAHEQVVLERPLDSMNWASQLVVVVLLTGLACGIWRGYTAIKNIGENNPPQNLEITRTTNGSSSSTTTVAAVPPSSSSSSTTTVAAVPPSSSSSPTTEEAPA